MGASAPIEAWLVEIYQECLPIVMYVCLRRTGGREAMAKDIAHESFARLYEAVRKEPAKLPDKLSMTQYLYAIAANACTDHWRRSQNNKEQTSDLTALDVVDEEGLVTLLEQRDTLLRVRALIAELPPKLQEVIRLAFIEGKSNEEIAQCLDRPVESIRVDKTRGLNKLRELVKGKGQTISPGAALLVLFWISTTTA